MSRSPECVDYANLLSICRHGEEIDLPLLRELIGAFVIDNRSRLEEVHGALAAGDRETLRRLVHAVGGSAAMLGAGHLNDLARRVELAAPRGELHDLARGVAAVAAEFERVVAALRRLWPEASS